jgi:hypothetical protein
VPVDLSIVAGAASLSSMELPIGRDMRSAGTDRLGLLDCGLRTGRARGLAVACALYLVALCGSLVMSGAAIARPVNAWQPVKTDTRGANLAPFNLAPLRVRVDARHRSASGHGSSKPHRRNSKSHHHSSRHRGRGNTAVACRHRKRCPKAGVSDPTPSAGSSAGGSQGGPTQPGVNPPASQDQSPPTPTRTPSSESSTGDSPVKTPSPESPSKENSPETPSSDSEPLRLFSTTSVFNQALPATATPAANSAHLVSAFEDQVNRYYGHVIVNTTEWSAPVYVVGPKTPTVALLGESSICPRPEGVFSGFQQQIDAVPLPTNALPAAGTDKEVIVWQPSTGHLWELWRALDESGHWTACWGGEIANAYTSDGVFPAPFGAGASGLSLLGGQIHLEDLEHGAINHALEVLIPDTAGPEFVSPADRTDGASEDADAIPEGTHFRLDPKLSLGSLHLSPAALEIATAIQRYGMIVGDTGGSVALQAQDPTPLIEEGKPNPYDALLPNPYEALNAIPWSKLEVVSPDVKADAARRTRGRGKRLRRAS